MPCVSGVIPFSRFGLPAGCGLRAEEMMLLPSPTCSAPRCWFWVSLVGLLPLLRRMRGGLLVPVPGVGGGCLPLSILLLSIFLCWAGWPYVLCVLFSRTGLPASRRLLQLLHEFRLLGLYAFLALFSHLRSRLPSPRFVVFVRAGVLMGPWLAGAVVRLGVPVRPGLGRACLSRPWPGCLPDSSVPNPSLGLISPGMFCFLFSSTCGLPTSFRSLPVGWASTLDTPCRMPAGARVFGSLCCQFAYD